MKKFRLKNLKKINVRVLITSLGVLLLVGGILSLIWMVRSQRTNIVQTPQGNSPSVTKTVVTPKVDNYISGNPVRVTIPSLNIDLPIIPGYYNAKSQTWTLTTDKVQYATITPMPNNQEGNTFIYGHYRKNVFASLHTIQAGAEAVVYTDNGHVFTYRLNNVRTVDPADSSAVFSYQGTPILTVQTCTGLFFQNRQLFTFDLEKAV